MDFTAIQMTILEAESHPILVKLAESAGMNGTRGRVRDVHLNARDCNVPDGRGWYQGGSFSPTAVEFGNVIYSVLNPHSDWRLRDAIPGDYRVQQAALADLYPLYCRYRLALHDLYLMYGWREDRRIHWMDNSIEVILRSALNPALTSRETIVAPHGDACY
jgi:hypothetical protein